MDKPHCQVTGGGFFNVYRLYEGLEDLGQSSKPAYANQYCQVWLLPRSQECAHERADNDHYDHDQRSDA